MGVAGRDNRVRNELIYRGLFSLRLDARSAPELVDQALDAILDWADDVSTEHTGQDFRSLSGREVDAITWEASSGSFAIAVAQDTARDRHAVRVSTADPAAAYRRWIVNACTYVEGASAALDVQLFSNTIGAHPAPERVIPEIVRRIGARGVLCDGIALRDTPRMAMTARDAAALAGEIRDSRRRMPFIVVSEPFAIDGRELARTLYGVANVALVGSDASFTLTAALGKALSTYGGAVRTYRPGLDVERDDPFLHPLVLPTGILNYRDAAGHGREAFLRTFTERAYRALLAGLADQPLHDVLWVRRALVDERRANEQGPSTSSAPVTAQVEVEEPTPQQAPSAELVPERTDADDDVQLLREELRSALERVDDAARQAREAEERAERFETDFYQLVGENEALRREIDGLRVGGYGRFAEPAEAALPGVRDLLLGYEALMRGIHGVVNDVGALLRERDEAVRRRFAAEQSRSLQPQRPEPVQLSAPYSYDDPNALAEYVAQRYEGRLVLHPRALDTWKDGQFEDFEHLYAALDVLGRDFHALHFRTPDDIDVNRRYQERLEELNLRDGGAISDSEFGRFRSEYEVQWKGRPIRVDRHLRAPRHGNTTDPRRVLAIYYFWDDEAQATIITALPGHARNRLTP